MDARKIKTALISVFHKEGLEPLIRLLHQQGVQMLSTGGTYDFIVQQGLPCERVEERTSYPSILGGRVKTLHPKIFGGILARRPLQEDRDELIEYDIPTINLVITDLYPFEDTVASGAAEEDIIEKIDIGGVSLIRAAAKNFNEVVVVPSRRDYDYLLRILKEGDGSTTLEQRRYLAARAFNISSHYDTAIHHYFQQDEAAGFNHSIPTAHVLRYGENPHQKGVFYGDLKNMFDKLHGKELSYNNLLDVDAAVNLMREFDEPTFAILKHNNACGVASRECLTDAYKDALAGDPISAFGGIFIANETIDLETAEAINERFCEVIVAPFIAPQALEVLKSKKNRIVLMWKEAELPKKLFRRALNGVLEQDCDMLTDRREDMEPVTKVVPTAEQLADLEFACKICKHTKSNAIVLAKDRQLLASGTGQASRVDALKQAIGKARSFHFDLNGAVMASDAFFPFPDCVEIADEAGIAAVIQPGGSIRDQLSIDYCNRQGLAMVFTGTRHFKH